MRKTAAAIILACMAYVAVDVASQDKATERAITFDHDRDVSGEPFFVQLQDIPQIVIDDPACVCNCDGKCMAAIADLRAEVAALKDKCENCEGCQAPRPLQSSMTKAVGGSVTLNGRSIDPDTYIAQHDGYNAPHWSIHNHENIANVHSHLRDHGFRGFEGLPKSKLMALHQAVHHAGEGVTSRQVQVPRSTTSGCANGNCSRPTRRLFSRRR